MYRFNLQPIDLDQCFLPVWGVLVILVLTLIAAQYNIQILTTEHILIPVVNSYFMVCIAGRCWFQRHFNKLKWKM